MTTTSIAEAAAKDASTSRNCDEHVVVADKAEACTSRQESIASEKMRAAEINTRDRG